MVDSKSCVARHWSQCVKRSVDGFAEGEHLENDLGR